ncbi:NADH-quinone oxidoreductase subunit C [Candidatus Bathyarchaeota archaeon]|nr:NADH-quinone oxidoreductase subunit C [Candidatus Bathyarchaeota archaeon]
MANTTQKSLGETVEIEKNLRETLGSKILDLRVPRERRIFVSVERAVFKEVVEYLTKNLEFKHLTTITGRDAGGQTEVIYHLNRRGVELSLKVQVPSEEAILPTITDLIPGAVLYEREVHDLLGVKFEGHPDLSPLLLPDGWPAGVHPLKKEWTVEKIREKLASVEKK